MKFLNDNKLPEIFEIGISLGFVRFNIIRVIGVSMPVTNFNLIFQDKTKEGKK